MKSTVLYVRVDEELKKQFEQHCRDNQLTTSGLIRDLMIEELNNKESLTTIYSNIKSIFDKLSQKADGAILSTWKNIEETLVSTSLMLTMMELLVTLHYQDKIFPGTMREKLKELHVIRGKLELDLESTRATLEEISNSVKNSWTFSKNPDRRRK